MNMITNHLPTAELQALDAAHHMHPFTGANGLAEKGARVITGATGVHLRDSEGTEILDCMAGLWCVNIGYGRDSIAEVARRQLLELPYYNTFFQTTHVPAIALAEKVTSMAPDHMNHVFFAAGGSDANDTNIRLVRHYWALKGKPEKTVIISRKNAYHGSTVGAASLGGMQAMHAQGTLPIPGIAHINQPHWYIEGGDMTPEEFGLQRARELAHEKVAEKLSCARVADLYLALGRNEISGARLVGAINGLQDPEFQIGTRGPRRRKRRSSLPAA